MSTRHGLSAQLETVTLPDEYERGIVAQYSIPIGDGIFDDHGRDRPGRGLRVEVPTVIDVVVSDAETEGISFPYREFRRETIGVVCLRVGIIVRHTREHGVVRRPHLTRLIGGTGDLQPRVSVVVGFDALDPIVVAR